MLYHDLMAKEQAAALKGSMLKGRQIMFASSSKTNRRMEFLYTIEDLV